MKKIEKLKNEICTKAKAAGANCDEYKKALNSSSEDELLKVIYDNIGWCLENKIVDNTYLSKFTAKALLDSGLANTGLENTGIANSGNWNSGNSNSGNWNSGNWNSGNRNSGNSNSGNSNSGNWNSGNRNSGNRNSGNWNSGNSNSGNWNSGNRNSGNSNSGNSNSGNWNSGNWNSGDRNSGDSNSGYRNSGAFCTDPNPKMLLFNKPSKYTVKEWEQTKAVDLMYSIDTTIWVPANIMTDEEKAAHPKWETTEGYLKTIPRNEAWNNAWNNWDEASRAEFTSLENFSWDIFTEITGIKDPTKK